MKLYPVSIAVAALLLIVPGFFTDFWFYAFIPLTRKVLFKLTLKNSKPDIKSQRKNRR